MNKHYRQRVLPEYGISLALLLILSLAAYLRLSRVAVNPGFYSDEGTQINIAANLLQGRVQYLCLTKSTLLAARLPLFPILLAAIFHFTGVSITAARLFTGILGVLTVALLYAVVRQVLGRQGTGLALLAALMLAIYPEAIIYNRMTFSYNLLAPLVLLLCFGLWRYLQTVQRRWLALAALAIGVGLISDLFMALMVLPFLVVISARRKSDLFWSLPIIVMPFGIYSVVMLATVPDAFLFDLRYTLSRTVAIPLVLQLPVIALNEANLLARDPWFAPGIAGLFLLRPRCWQRLSLLLFLLPATALGRTDPALSRLTFYYFVPLLPFIALGVAAFLYFITPRIKQILEDNATALFQRWGIPPGSHIERRLTVLCVGPAIFCILLSLFAVGAGNSLSQVPTQFATRMDPVMVNARSARRVAAYINRHAKDTDLVVASPAVAWMYHTQVADFQLTFSAEGKKTLMFPAQIPSDRFSCDARYTRAKYVVIDDIWRNFAACNLPAAAALMNEAIHWPQAYRAGSITVYRNPAISEQASSSKKTSVL